MKKGWEIKKLGEVCDFKSGTTIDSKLEKAEGEIIYAKVGDMNLPNNEHFITVSSRYVNLNEINENQIIPEGSIIFPKRGGAIATNKKRRIIKPTIVDLNTMALIPSKIIDKDYLFFWFQQINLADLSNGTSIPQINNYSFNDISIPLPPLSIQAEIVSILEETFDAVAQVKANAEQNLKNAKALFESYLQSVFENKGEGWEERTLGEVANTNGRIGWKGLTAKEYKNDGPLFLSVHSLNHGDYVDFSRAFHISQARYDESPEIMLKKDDILICKDGAGIGKLGIVPKLPDVATINSSLLLIRSKNEVLSKYLYYNLLSPLFQNIVQSKLMGATTPHLYQRDIVTFPILLPNLSEQQRIIDKLETLSTETKRLEAIYAQKLKDLEDLKKAILEKAFRGELKR